MSIQWHPYFAALLRPLKELAAMVRKKGPNLKIAPIAEVIGLKSIIDEIGLRRIIEEAGTRRVVSELGAKKIVSELGPEEVIKEVGTDHFIDIAFRHLSGAERAEMKRRARTKSK